MIEEFRQQFPIFQHYPQLTYLDNAATTQKPQAVLTAWQDFYSHANANPYRGVYQLAELATAKYQWARERVAQFLHAPEDGQIVFVRGATEAVNLVAESFGRAQIRQSDYLVTSVMEHHSNFLPWQRLAQQRGAQLYVVNLTPEGELDLADFERVLQREPKIVALTHLSNVLGTVNPVAQLIRLAHQAGAAVLIDGAQAVGHLPVDLTALDPDFYLFSGHKLYAPQGVGVLYIKGTRVAEMAPYQLGGGMVQQVALTGSSFAIAPQRFEAGTPNVGGAVALATALEWLSQQDLAAWWQRDQQLSALLRDELTQRPEIQVLGGSSGQHKRGVVSWTMNQLHPHDIATFLAQDQIAVRAGHHCAMPLMSYYQQPATVRASLAIYNDLADIERLLSSLDRLRQWWYK